MYGLTRVEGCAEAYEGGCMGCLDGMFQLSIIIFMIVKCILL